ncbi:hypothetical protein F383_36834 [Gossypium arboreum]|uniref:Uncharacterized protein n=1 Tax=Gossypium arboreum TaxID=29729 RepID=A0A0B0MAI7_GOSAR|nr:hypothetical protein F383_36834 [Gossypium arboreum]
MVLHYLSHICADAMSQTWSYTNTSIHAMPCPRHGLTLTHLEANACPRHVLHCLTNNPNVMA